VLARGVEHFLMTRVVEMAKERSLPLVRGEYIPTAKNGMVRDFYQQFGFQKVAESNGRSEWHLDPNAYKPRKIYISGTEDFKGQEGSWTERALAAS
jgi:predicted enzyme involved in methoxymalonyl-ACP biosynthesis